MNSSRYSKPVTESPFFIYFKDAAKTRAKAVLASIVSYNPVYLRSCPGSAFFRLLAWDDYDISRDSYVIKTKEGIAEATALQKLWFDPLSGKHSSLSRGIGIARSAMLEGIIQATHECIPDYAPVIEYYYDLKGMSRIRKLFQQYMSKTTKGSFERCRLALEILMEKEILGLKSYIHSNENIIAGTPGDFSHLDLSRLDLSSEHAVDCKGLVINNSNCDFTCWKNIKISANLEGSSLRGVDMGNVAFFYMPILNGADIEGSLFGCLGGDVGYLELDNAINADKISQTANDLVRFRMTHDKKTFNEKTISQFFSINHRRKIQNQLTYDALTRIGFFLTPDDRKNIDVIKNSHRRLLNIELNELLSMVNYNEEGMINECKALLSNGAEVIGDRSGQEFCRENIGAFFNNEKHWPPQLQALIYLQVYIQKGFLPQEQACMIKRRCLESSFNDEDCHFEITDLFLKEIYRICIDSQLLPEVKILGAFKLIYPIMIANDYFKAHRFLNDHQCLPCLDFIKIICQKINNDPYGTTTSAWSLAKNHYQNISIQNDNLITEIATFIMKNDWQPVFYLSEDAKQERIEKIKLHVKDQLAEISVDHLPRRGRVI